MIALITGIMVGIFIANINEYRITLNRYEDGWIIQERIWFLPFWEKLSAASYETREEAENVLKELLK